MLEAHVSRLYGHSSSSGALRVKGEPDCIALFEQKLLEAGVLDSETIKNIHREAKEEVEAALEQTHSEPRPSADDVERFTFAPSPVDAVYPGDYTGLPQ
jgi:2-oxoisovalerate dehydrogenase E1 component alpha subunit